MRTETLLSTQVITTFLSQSPWPLSGAYLDRVASVASYLLLFLPSKLVQGIYNLSFCFHNYHYYSTTTIRQERQKCVGTWLKCSPNVILHLHWISLGPLLVLLHLGSPLYTLS